MNNCATIVKIDNLRKHENADKLQMTTIFGNQVVVGLDVNVGDIGIYFETNLQLSKEYCEYNNLIRNVVDGVNIGGMFDENRKVRTQKLRGEKSDGFYMPLSSLNFIENLPKLELNFEFTSINGIEICRKYVSPNQKISGGNANKPQKAKFEVPMLVRHNDTSHFGKNKHLIKPNSKLVITEKLHGTSGAIGNVLVKLEPKNKLMKWIYKVLGVEKNEYQYVQRTRNVVLNTTQKRDTAYHSDSIREYAMSLMKDKLHKNEVVYFEIVGFEGEKYIMPSGSNDKLGKDFMKVYGKNTEFRYGCLPKECKVYVYRIAMSNPDGNQIDYTYSDMAKRCSELGLNVVPLLKEIYVTDVDATIQEIEDLTSGSSTLDNHIREGIVVRFDDNTKDMLFLKNKSFEFKVIEGLISDVQSNIEDES